MWMPKGAAAALWCLRRVADTTAFDRPGVDKFDVDFKDDKVVPHVQSDVLKAATPASKGWL